MDSIIAKKPIVYSDHPCKISPLIKRWAVRLWILYIIPACGISDNSVTTMEARDTTLDQPVRAADKDSSAESPPPHENKSSSAENSDPGPALRAPEKGNPTIYSEDTIAVRPVSISGYHLALTCQILDSRSPERNGSVVGCRLGSGHAETEEDMNLILSAEDKSGKTVPVRRLSFAPQTPWPYRYVFEGVRAEDLTIKAQIGDYKFSPFSFTQQKIEDYLNSLKNPDR